MQKIIVDDNNSFGMLFQINSNLFAIIKYFNPQLELHFTLPHMFLYRKTPGTLIWIKATNTETHSDQHHPTTVALLYFKPTLINRQPTVPPQLQTLYPSFKIKSPSS